MFKQINKRFLYVLLATFIVMILGLSFIGGGKLKAYYPGVSTPLIVQINGFDAINWFTLGHVLSSEVIKSALVSSSGLGLIRCGIVFAVIFTPILGVISLGGITYDFMKIMKINFVPIKKYQQDVKTSTIEEDNTALMNE